MKPNEKNIQNDNNIDWKQRALAAEAELAELTARLDLLEKQIRLKNHKTFGSSSEKTTALQQPLPMECFNEAEATADPNAKEPDITEIKAHKRKKRRSQKELFEGLPEQIIEHKLSNEERACSCCGEDRHVIGTETSRELRVIPAKFWVDVHVQYVYGCRQCEQNEGTDSSSVVTADKPRRPFPGSIASPSAIAYTMDQKYSMGLPLYRQAQQWQRSGVNISRQTLSNWVIKPSDMWLTPLWERMKEFLLAQDIIHGDETTVQVLKEDGKTATSTSYMWLYRSGREGPPIILMEYQPSRSGKHPKEFLKDFRGFLCTDGYPGYNQVEGVTRLGCLSHARRKFTDTIKAAGGDKKAPRAVEGRNFCDQLFLLEQKWDDSSAEERYKQRLNHSKPLLKAFLAWLHETKENTHQRTYLGKAVEYCLSQWEPLTNFLLDGRLEVSNNSSERSIKPYVISRRTSCSAIPLKELRLVPPPLASSKRQRQMALNPLNTWNTSSHIYQMPPPAKLTNTYPGPQPFQNTAE